VRLRALGVETRQRDHVGVLVLVEKEKAKVERMADFETGCAASLAMPALRGDLGQNVIPVGRDQADQFRSHHRVAGH
jgi:hypothetical protein